VVLSFLLFFSLLHSDASVNKNQYQELKKVAFSNEKDMQQRWKALMELSKIPNTERKKDLQEAAKSKVWFMRNASLLAMNEVDPIEARKMATQLLVDPSLVVRSAAVEVLAPQLKTSVEIRKTFWSQFQNKQNIIKSRSLWIRPQILKHLAEAPVLSEAEIFADLASSSEVEIREIANSALKKIK